MKNKRTFEEVGPGNTEGCLPEFGRIGDVNRLFGIKRGTLYNLINANKIRSVLLRPTGRQRGVRLIHLDSVRSHLQQLMAN